MANVVLGHPVFSDVGVTYAPAFSGGSYESDLPLANVQNRALQKVARTTDATTGSTQFVVDLGVSRSVGLLAILIPNVTKSATPEIRWRGSPNADLSSPTLDQTIDLWPSGVTAEDVAGLNVWSVLPFTSVSGRYWGGNISDTANADGYLDIARVMVMGRYQPSFNMSYGAKHGLEDDSTRDVSDGGAALYQQKRKRRTFDFQIEHLPEAEAYGSAWKFQRQVGKTGQFFFVADPDDTTLMHERAFPAVLRQLSALDYLPVSRNSMGFSIVEDI